MNRVGMKKSVWTAAVLAMSLLLNAMCISSFAAEKNKRVFMVIFENTDASKALKQPFFKQLANQGGYLKKSYAVARPSQPNYLALIAGDTFKVRTDKNVNIDHKHLGDALEALGRNWRVYAEDYPQSYTERGKCFTKATRKQYARKHVPFLSFTNVSGNDQRCSTHVFSADQLDVDLEKGELADFSLFIPNDTNNGHDTGVAHADQWFKKRFSNLLRDERFIKNTVFIATFDESSYLGRQHIYTVFYGAGVKPGSQTSQRYTHFDVFRTLEDIFGVAPQGAKDGQSQVIKGIWLTH